MEITRSRALVRSPHILPIHDVEISLTMEGSFGWQAEAPFFSRRAAKFVHFAIGSRSGSTASSWVYRLTCFPLSAALFDTRRNLLWLGDAIGDDTLLSDIDGDLVSKIVAKRRGERSKNGGALVTNATVNRTVTEPLKRLFKRAQLWGVRFDREPEWKRLILPEPQERVRELDSCESDQLNAAMRADYEPFFAFACATGLRLRECILRWDEVDWRARQIVKTGKGGKRVTIPITPTLRSILSPLQGHHPTEVFTYIATRTRDGRVKGRRYALTYNGVKTAWRRLRKCAGVEDFRFHDFRHDFASKLLRETGNLKLVQRALNHADLKSTLRYAHVLGEEVAEALEQVQKSRNKSRTTTRKAC